jgi:outer membrane protein assembly factor BamA
MRSFLATFLLTGALCFSASAQTVVAKAINFTGASQSQAELLTLSGLTRGQTLSKDDIEAAMHRLDDSGLFADIQYSVSSGTLTFALAPAAKSQMQRVQYGNFVWYTQTQLNDSVHAKLPLFTGSVPANGELKDQVARALEAIMKERGIDATVDSQGISGGKLEYSITSPKVIVGEVKIENINFDSDPVLVGVRKYLVGAEYLEDITAKAVDGNLSYALKELGFLDETVGPISHAEPVVQPGRILVSMVGSAVPGARYTVAHVALPAPVGTVTAKELESEHQVQQGGRPSPSLVENTVARLAFVFAGHGFLDAKADVDPVKDSAAHTMSYTFHVVPGEVYHLRDVFFGPGLSAEQRPQIMQAWKLPKGSVYERAVVAQSLQAPSVKGFCSGRPATEQLLPDKATHEVDIKLSCGNQRPSQ